MRVLGYAAAARRRRSREYSFSCTPGWRPGVSRAALLHRRLQLSSAQPRAANLRTTAMLDTPLTHGCVHRTERVQQQPSATIIRCVQWMQRSRNHSQSLWRPACLPYSTHNQKLGTWYLVVMYRGNGGIRRGIYQLQGDDNGHVGRPREVSPARPCPELLCELRGLCRRSYFGPRTCGRSN